MGNDKRTYANVTNPNSVKSNFFTLKQNEVLPKIGDLGQQSDVSNPLSEKQNGYTNFGGSHPLGTQHEQWLNRCDSNLNGVVGGRTKS